MLSRRTLPAMPFPRTLALALLAAPLGCGGRGGAATDGGGGGGGGDAGTQSRCAAVAVTVGANHSCYLKADGSVWCWGRNSNGELGRTGLGSPVPTASVSLPDKVTAISSGRAWIGCAIISDASLWCWGVAVPAKRPPTAVTGFATGVKVAAPGESHSCVVSTEGSVWCWGMNSSGELGDGTTTRSDTPVMAKGFETGVTGVGVGDGFTCALKQDGSLWCWGTDSEGQLGDGYMGAPLIPGMVPGFETGTTNVSVGESYACAVKSEGSLSCWGYNMDSQLGNDMGGIQPRPIAVQGLGPVSQVAAGNDHTCAVKLDGSVWCWGSNTVGQLGDGTTKSRSQPAIVSGLTAGIIQVSVENLHSCAVTKDGRILCWGANGDGDLGDGTNAMRLAPVEVNCR